MSEEEFTLYLIVAMTFILTIFALYVAFHIVQDFNTIHFQAVNECVEMNKAANATVCLV